jgi:hypothetical protein
MRAHGLLCLVALETVLGLDSWRAALGTGADVTLAYDASSGAGGFTTKEACLGNRRIERYITSPQEMLWSLRPS